MKCSSLKNRRQRCGNRGLVTIGDITSMTVVKQMSKKKCNSKKSYGFKRKSIWVNKGCSAVFKVCIGKGRSDIKQILFCLKSKSFVFRGRE
jgi:hypothetical protein